MHVNIVKKKTQYVLTFTMLCIEDDHILQISRHRQHGAQASIHLLADHMQILVIHQQDARVEVNLFKSRHQRVEILEVAREISAGGVQRPEVGEMFESQVQDRVRFREIEKSVGFEKICREISFSYLFIYLIL